MRLKFILITLFPMVFLCLVFTFGRTVEDKVARPILYSERVKTQPASDTVRSLLDSLPVKDPKLATLLKTTNRLLSVFQSLSPFDDSVQLHKLDLTAAERKEILNGGDSAETTDTESVGDESDLQEGVIVIGALDGMIVDKILQVLAQKSFNRYDPTKLFKDYIAVVPSPDGLLYCLSYDQQTGGTYRSNTAILYYRGNKQQPPFSMLLSHDEQDGLASDGYDSIELIPTTQGVKYLLSGQIVGCGTCFGHYVDLVHITRGKAVSDFHYNLDSGNPPYAPFEDEGPTIVYDAKNRILRIDYLMDDRTPFCNCGINGSLEANEEPDSNDPPKYKSVSCKYRFNGQTFVRFSAVMRNIKIKK